jgi:hypothetical protein
MMPPWHRCCGNASQQRLCCCVRWLVQSFDEVEHRKLYCTFAWWQGFKCCCVCGACVLAQAMAAAFGRPADEVFSYISPRPVAAASLGQVYRAQLRPQYGSGEVAVKVQRPGVLEQVRPDPLYQYTPVSISMLHAVLGLMTVSVLSGGDGAGAWLNVHTLYCVCESRGDAQEGTSTWG